MRDTGYAFYCEGREAAVCLTRGPEIVGFSHQPPAGWWQSGQSGQSPLVGLWNAAHDDTCPAWAATWGQSWPIPDEQCEPLADVLRTVCRAGGIGDPNDDLDSFQKCLASMKRFYDARISEVDASTTMGAWSDLARLSLGLGMTPIKKMAGAGADNPAPLLGWDAACTSILQVCAWCLLDDPFRVKNDAFAPLHEILEHHRITPSLWRGLTAPQRFSLVPAAPPLYALSTRAVAIPVQLFGGSAISLGRAGDDASMLARLGGLDFLTYTDSLPALVWREAVWAIREDFRLRACGDPRCKRFFLSPRGQGDYCAEHSIRGAKGIPPAKQAAWKRYIQRHRADEDAMGFATWEKGYDARRKGRKGR